MLRNLPSRALFFGSVGDHVILTAIGKRAMQLFQHVAAAMEVNAAGCSGELFHRAAFGQAPADLPGIRQRFARAPVDRGPVRAQHAGSLPLLPPEALASIDPALDREAQRRRANRWYR